MAFCSALSSTVSCMCWCALIATVVHVASGVRIGTVEENVFPWHLGSCSSIEDLTAEDLRQATNWGASSAGNNGGVHFLALEKGCIVVIKPTVDLHEVFAQELGMALKAPVIPTRALKEGDPMFQAVQDGISKAGGSTLGPRAKDIFVQSISPTRVVMLMGLAPGKDLYDLTAGFDFKACQECAEVAAQEATATVMGDPETEKIQAVKFQIESDSVSPFYKGFVEEVAEAIEEKEGRKPDEKELSAAVEEWMKTKTADKRNPLAKIAAQRAREYSKQLALAQKCANTNGAKEQSASTLSQVSGYIEECASSEKTIDDFAALSAFLSIIGENDGMPTVDSPYVSNMHNVFVTAEGVAGIDLAVGGALTHKSIRADGSGGQFLGSWTPFLLNDLIRAGQCKADVQPEVVAGADAFMSQIALKLRMPYFNNDFHKYAFACRSANGSAIAEGLAQHAAEWINGLVPGHLKSSLRGIGEQIRKVEQKLAGIGEPKEMEDITGWLEKRTEKLLAAESEASTRCGNVPSSPEQNYLLTCIAQVWKIVTNVKGARTCKEVFDMAFGKYGEEAATMAPRCARRSMEEGRGMCCVQACKGSLSKLGCLKDCQKLQLPKK